MIVSEARITANRLNSARSTGPRTPEGKDRSRANALKHGLCAVVLVPEDIAQVSQRASDWYYALKPQNSISSWLVGQIAVASIRIDRAERMERKLRDRQMLRAELDWDDDRALEAEELGAKISRRPSEVARKLKKTPHGCTWMLARWAMLARSAELDTSWTPEQVQLAFNLLGTPPELREGSQPGDVIDLDGKILEAAEGPAVIARREVASLQERREVVAELDEVDRALTAADLLDESNAELKRVRRYETTLHTRIRWSMEQIKYRSPHAQCNPDFKPAWVERDDRPEVASKAIEPTPDEVPAPVEEVDLPEVVSPRREKKARKVESRRESKRRKAERLRA